MNKKDFQNANNRLPSPASGGGGEPAGYDDNVIGWRITMTGTIRTSDS